MAVIESADPLAADIVPVLILNYGYENASRNAIIDLLASEYPAVFLRPAASKSGTLSMLFSSGVDARAAAAILNAPNRFHFEEPAAGEEFDFVRAGAVSTTKVEGIDYWITNVDFREVEPA